MTRDRALTTTVDFSEMIKCVVHSYSPPILVVGRVFGSLIEKARGVLMLTRLSPRSDADKVHSDPWGLGEIQQFNVCSPYNRAELDAPLMKQEQLEMFFTPGQSTLGLEFLVKRAHMSSKDYAYPMLSSMHYVGKGRHFKSPLRPENDPECWSPGDQVVWKTVLHRGFSHAGVVLSVTFENCVSWATIAWSGDGSTLYDNGSPGGIQQLGPARQITKHAIRFIDPRIIRKLP